jgi:hypothetical protein
MVRGKWNRLQHTFLAKKLDPSISLLAEEVEEEGGPQHKQ